MHGFDAAGNFHSVSLSEPRKIIFWRHGQTDWNAQKRFQGQSNIPLNASGEMQAKAAGALLGARLAAAGGQVVLVSSDLLRARATAQVLADELNVEVTEDPRFRETFGGVWQGKTFTEISAEYPEEVAAWQSDLATATAGGGERRSEVAERMRAGVIDQLAQLSPGGTLVVVTHGGATRVAIAHVLGLPEELWKTLGGLSNCHWSVLEQMTAGSEPGDYAVEHSGAALANAWKWRLTEHNVGVVETPAAKDLAGETSSELGGAVED